MLIRKHRIGQLITLVMLLRGVTAFGLSGTSTITDLSLGRCVGDSWTLELQTAFPYEDVKLTGVSNGKEWSIPQWGTSDGDRRFHKSGVWDSDAIGKHTIQVHTWFWSSDILPLEVSKCDVYVMSGGNAGSDQAVMDVLTARGHTPALGVEPWRWDGTQQKLKNFDTVVLLNNFNWDSPDMPASGQQALLEYVAQGGGLVTGEWLIWNVTQGEKFRTISPLSPAIATSYDTASSATYVQAQEDPIINRGLPYSFSFELNDIEGSQSVLEPKAGSTVFYHGGLIGRHYLEGRVISFSTLLSHVELTDPNYARLFGNVVEWAERGHSIRPFAIPDGGGLSLQNSRTPGLNLTGYGAIQPENGSAAPAGLAILGLRQNNVLVSETIVPASSLIQSGRTFAEVNGAVNTGIAIANPNDQPASVSFYFTDDRGDFGHGTTTIPARSQIAAFVNEAPFNGPSLMTGTVTFTSSVPAAFFAARGLTNERSEFLTAALPVADLHAAISHETAVVPYFAEGHGWTTQILLVNLTDSALIGHVELRNQAGELMPVMRYSIPPRGSQKLGISGGTAPVLAGSALLVPESGTPTPGGLVLLSFQDRGKGITVAEAGIPAVPTGSAFRLHVEAKGDFDHGAANSIQTGLAIANKSTSPATLSLDLRRLDGSSTNLLGSLIIPVNGQVTTLLKQIPGFDALPPDFEGILRVSGPESLSVVGVRGRYNERKDFLISVTPPVNEAARPSTAPLYFPLIVDSENFTTQFVLFPSQPGLVSSGEIRFFAQNGESLYLRLK